MVFLAIAIPALLGLIGLALDGTRFMSLDTELANVADAAALAAASRLDRSEFALPQARDAALALTNGSSAGRVRLAFRFAANLSDLQRAGYSLSDAAGASASYVEVSTAETSLAVSFLQLLGVRATSVRRRAIAESQYFACDVTPALLCHPHPADFAAQAQPGSQFLLHMDGNIETGSIVLLDRPDTGSDREALLNLATNAPQFCYADRVRIRRNISPVDYDAAIDIRFDRYVSRTGPVAPDIALYPPAPNVIQGRHLESCNALPQGGDINPPFHLPRDSAYNGFNPAGLWNQGSGDWKISTPNGGTGYNVATALDEYIAWNHSDKGPDFKDRLRTAATRYDLYLAELGLTRQTETVPVDTRGLDASVATMPTGGPSSGSLSLRRENPAPVCYAGSQPAVEARRRILYLAVSDCGAFPGAATAENLSRYVGKFFLTEPTDLGRTLVEFVGMVRPTADDGKLRHVVQLVTGD